MKRSASAVWHGDLKTGHGNIATPSGVMKDTPYSFKTRFEESHGTNPEELLAAAHAACFTMALSAALSTAGHAPKRLATQATATLEQIEGKWTISTFHLENESWVPGISAADFDRIAADAKANCPVSRLFRADITLHAKLEPEPS
ncbi:MAG TPA: OsmC family protein [Steroidobacteraceae bacterium]|nr:OsmC family protein [Steroidobacteraceae bacterium]